MYNVENFKKELYKPGDQLVIKCIPGYQLKGTSVIECQSDGTWYPTSNICIPKHVDPQSFADGMPITCCADTMKPLYPSIQCVGLADCMSD